MSVRTSFSRHARRPLTLAVALALAALTQGALAASPLPSGFDHTGLYGNVGAPTMDPTGRTMTITQTSKGAVIQWDSFNIGQGYHVAFAQPGSDSVTLNRVTGNGGASQINGLLSAPGRVFVVNPSGVMFGSSAQINVGGLVASTLDISDANFISGVNSGSFAFAGNVGGDGISNAGSIITSAGGTIALLSADTVSNSSTLNAPGGTVALGWGRSLVLDVGGDGLTNLVIGPNGRGQGRASIVNSGTLQADGGQVVLRADVGDGMGVVNQGNIVQAHSLSSRGGVIVLDAGSNELDISGSNDASASDAGVAGGSITASADHLLVSGGAAFNAGGGSGGANGSLTINSLASVLIAGKDTLATESNDTTLSGYSLLLDSALGNALSHNTNVNVNALGNPASNDVSGVHDGTIWMMAGADSNTQNGNNQEIYFPDAAISKTGGGDARLTFNANRDIRLQAANNITTSGTSIGSSSGALNVDFNADATGVQQNYGNGNVESGGQIEMDGASIASNGGSVRFYGQSDPNNGRATGSTTYSANYQPGDPDNAANINTSGIELGQSTINTCAGTGACGGAGAISLRGQGTDQLSTGDVDGGLGIGLAGSTLTTGAGAISLDGRGGTGGYGVYITAYTVRDNIEFFHGRGTPSLLQSQQGSITINGVSGDQAIPPVGTPSPIVQGAGNGVSILGGSRVLAGGDLVITGTGGNLTPSRNAVTANGGYQDPSDGIEVVGAALQAGTGRTLTLTGTVGSAGAGLDGNGVPPPPVAAVHITEIAAYVDANNPGNDLPAIPSTLTAPAGTIRVSGTGDVYLDNSALSTQSPSGMGGSIGFNATNILLGANTTLDSSGSSGGGNVDMQASGVLAMDASASVYADAGSASGKGGTITLDGSQGLYAYGSLSARGGTAGGDGGQIETSGSGLDLRGLNVDAGSTGGTAGAWLIDPYNVTITHGTAAGTLATNPFVPIATTTIQDGDINKALDGGSSVTITTGNAATGTDAGNINFNAGVAIERNTGTAPLTFELDAHSKITGNGFSIVADPGTGPLNMLFDSDADQLLGFGNGGITLTSATLRSNGGNVDMYGQRNAATGYSGGINLGGVGMLIDTRVNGSDTAAAGNVLLRGHGGGYTGTGATGVSLGNNDYGTPGMVITTGTGNIDVVGVGDNGGDGIALATSNVGPLQLITSSGHIALTGFGSTYATPFAGSGNGNGISSSIGYTGGISLQTDTGTIDLRGYGLADSNLGNGTILTHDGINLGAGTQLASNSGSILLSGSSQGSGAGIDLIGGLAAYANRATLIDAGNGSVVLRAHNDQAALVNPLQIGDTLSVQTSGTIDIRPGSVDANGNLVENPTDQIVIGAGNDYAGGINLSVANLAQLQAGTLVLGSDAQSGNVTISPLAGNITYAGNLTLQANGGGSVQLNGGTLDVGANTLALIATGDIGQAGAVTAGSLLAQSSGGAVTLDNVANNVSSATVAGSASGDFSFINAGTVGIGNVSAIGFTAASNTSATLTGNGIVSGGNVLVRAMKGDMLLGANVSGSNVDLVSSGIFDNTDGSTITAADNWRVWGDTWLGETRGGLAGSGNLPNLYGCSFGAACTSGIGVPTTDDHFIYTQRPMVTIDVGSASREYGLPDGNFGYAVNGMILGDQVGNAIAGTTATAATQASHVGNYAITGDFSSPAGYAVNLVAGTLAITPATLTYTANPFSRLYGDPNGTLGGDVSGFRNGDTLGSSTIGTLAFTSTATPGSNVGKYAIDGGGLQAGDYVFVQAPGNATALSITPATLTYVADPYRRMVGVPNGTLGGDVVGLRNGDTLGSATTGILAFQTTAGVNTPTGIYAINGGGLQANNYVFVQGPGNATALTITPPPSVYTLDVVRDTPVTYVYDRNFGIVGLCPATDLTSDSRDKDGDTLAREWSRVRSRPNLANCVSTKQKNSCGDF